MVASIAHLDTIRSPTSGTTASLLSLGLSLSNLTTTPESKSCGMSRIGMRI